MEGLEEDVLRWCTLGLGARSGEQTARIVCELDSGCKEFMEAPPCVCCANRVSRSPDWCEFAHVRPILTWTGHEACRRGSESLGIPTQ